MEFGRFTAQPSEEPGDLGVGGECGEMVEFPFQGFFGEVGVEEVVASPAETGQGLLQFGAGDVTAHAPISMSGFGDEVMDREFGDFAAAEFASFGHGCGRVRRGDWTRSGVEGQALCRQITVADCGGGLPRFLA